MDFLEILQRYIDSIAGKEGIKLLNSMKEHQNISEFTLAENLRLTINNVRNLLYKLNNHNLVYSIRKKDKEKGWYIYYWTFNFRHAKDILILNKQNKIKQLKEELEKQENFFKCKNDNTRLKYEDALENDYKCPECGCILEQEDFTKRSNEIQNEMHLLEEDLEELNKPLNIFPKEEVVEKKKIKRLRKKIAKKIKKGKFRKKIAKKIKRQKVKKKAKKKH